jgi:Flp pilus assembly protein TadD
MGTAYYAELMLGDIGRLPPSAHRLASANPNIVGNEMLQHARMLFDNGELAGARALIEVVVEYQPALPEAQLQLGMICNSLGDAVCAKAALTRFLELAPGHPDAELARSLLTFLE